MPFNLNTYLKVEHGRPSITKWMGALVALSLANFSYLRVWDLLLHNPQRNYLTSVPYGWIDHLAAILGVLLLGLILYGLINLVWHHGNRWHRALAMLAVFIVLILPLDFVRRSGGASIELMTGLSRFLIIAIVSSILFSLAILFRQRFWAFVFWGLAISSPYAVVNFGASIVRIAAPEKLYPRNERSEESERASVEGSRRLIWIIFDEWDQTILFERRPKELKLPVLDALIKESVVCSSAYSPARTTMVSVPALLQGRILASAFATMDSRLRIRLPGEKEWRNFQDEDSIVTDVLAMPAKATVLGWYHPYDRILPRSALLDARSYGFPAFEGIRGESVLGTLAAQYAYLALPVYGRMECRDLYKSMHSDALNVVADRSVKLILLHYSIPHAPGIYDAERQQFSTSMTSDHSGYIGNLALVDHTLGELLDSLEESGLRESTSLILTSDHWWRAAPWVTPGKGYPVPLIVQARPRGKTIRIEGSLSSTTLRGLANSLIRGEIKDNEGVGKRLSRETIAGETQYVDGILEIRNFNQDSAEVQIKTIKDFRK